MGSRLEEETGDREEAPGPGEREETNGAAIGVRPQLPFVFLCALKRSRHDHRAGRGRGVIPSGRF